MPEVSVKEINYGKYGRCVEVSNGIVDLVVTVDMGPRIIRFGFAGKENEFCENASMSKEIEGETWRLMGGHRLWHSPEGDPRSYMPENNPVEWLNIENGIKIVQKVEPWVQTKKEMEITLSPCCSKVKVVHRITNKNAWPIEFSVWALTLAAQGGIQVIPQPKRETGLLPNRFIALWPYAKMNDRRVYWGDKYIILKQDPHMASPFKIGIPNEEGWAAYFNHGNVFIIRYEHKIGAKYPDFGVSYETYTADFAMEMETLSPLTLVEPGDSAAHTEEWELIEGVDAPPLDEEEIHKLIDKYIRIGHCCK